MSSILLSIQNSVAIITLNRPDKFNSFNRSMALLLQQTLTDCANNDTIRCIVITGNGKAFSAGQDIAELVGDDALKIETILSEHYNPIIQLIRNIGKPIIAAVNGVAAGAGANIALCCDIVLANEQASFIQAFSKIGLVPDSAGTYFLPRLIGFQKASALMMTGDKVSATEAERMGMVFKVIAAADFEAAVLAQANTLAAMPTLGLAYTKEALNNTMNNNLVSQLAEEDRLQRIAAATSDFNEGITAFLEKRTPLFTGK
ncbi:enoyl-CoA hydratase-related protein [Ferruginibacter yonginensis]|uniref:Enoyl-CoA hydratase-related protein n=1 Tax=Ferruginibacter yonginensis TaxID=1310416 RepID=A0ABV8QRX0_9BACT